MKIGIVTVTYNSADVLTEFLECISIQTYKDFQLYVIDNNSQDSTLEVLNGFIEYEYHLIANSENLGVAAGNNQGIKAALDEGCEFVLLINNDTVFESKLIEKLVKAYQKYGSSVITPKMMYYGDDDKIWYAGGFFKKNQGWLNYHRGQGEKDVGQYDFDDLVEYAPTCCTLIQKSVFENVGIMDEKYFVYFDDTDFFYRIVKSGMHEIRYIYNVKFYHKIGSLTKSRTDNFKPKLGDFFVKQMTENQIYYLRKQGSYYSYLYIVFFILRLQLRFLFSGKYNINWKTFKLIQKSILKGISK
jgi:hypothetical protein